MKRKLKILLKTKNNFEIRKELPMKKKPILKIKLQLQTLQKQQKKRKRNNKKIN